MKWFESDFICNFADRYHLIFLQVDAIAATRMLTQRLRTDNIAYAVKPVSNFAHVLNNYRNYITSDIKTVFMINCGAVCDTK